MRRMNEWNEENERMRWLGGEWNEDYWKNEMRRMKGWNNENERSTWGEWTNGRSRMKEWKGEWKKDILRMNKWNEENESLKLTLWRKNIIRK